MDESSSEQFLLTKTASLCVCVSMCVGVNAEQYLSCSLLPFICVWSMKAAHKRPVIELWPHIHIHPHTHTHTHSL